VLFTVGKTGKITPVGEFEPVLVSGTTVQRASLCNRDEIDRLKLNVGDEIVIEKSNEIIPKIIEVAKKHSKGTVNFPVRCPVCGAKLAVHDKLVDIFCENPKCEGQRLAKLVYATSKSALDVQGCGEQLVRELIAGGIKDLGMLLSETSFDFVSSKAARAKLQAERKKALRAPYWRRIAALCIEGWGKTTCQEVAARWNSLNEIIDALAKKQLERVIGQHKSETFRAKIRSDIELIGELEELGFWDTEPGAKKGPVSGQVFCLTGAMTDCPNREQVADAIVERGGLCKSSVSRKVHYLVVGESPGASKLTAAKRHGTKTISPDELYDMLKWRPTA